MSLNDLHCLRPVCQTPVRAVQLPKTACLNPGPSFYSLFNGYTLGMVAMLLTLVALWVLGRHVIAPWTLRSMTLSERDERVTKFNNALLQRTLFLLYLVYPGVRVVIFQMCVGCCATTRNC